MTLSKARDRARKRIERLERGVLPDSNLALSCLPPDERKLVLKEIALHAIETPVSAGHRIAAIKEINLMEHVYDGGNIRDVNVVFVIGKGYSDTQKILPIGEVQSSKNDIRYNVIPDP